MKKFFLIFGVILIIFLIIIAAAGFWVKNNLKSISLTSFLNLINGKGKILMDEEDRDILNNKSDYLKNKIYEEATEHNPEGDVLPDEIDDMLKEKMKDEAKKRLE